MAAARRTRPGRALTACPPAPLAQTYAKAYNYKEEPDLASTSWRSFTQLIWKSSKRVGCAIQACVGNYIDDGGRLLQIKSVHVRCLYDPPGNILDEYLANVLAP